MGFAKGHQGGRIVPSPTGGRARVGWAQSVAPILRSSAMAGALGSQILSNWAMRVPMRFKLASGAVTRIWLVRTSNCRALGLINWVWSRGKISAAGVLSNYPAEYNLYDIIRDDASWRVRVSARRFDAATRAFAGRKAERDGARVP